MELLFMDPVFKEAIWGGTKLRDVFDYEIPSDTTGECWSILFAQFAQSTSIL